MPNAIGIAFFLVAACLGWNAIVSLVAGLRSSSWLVARGSLDSVTILKKRGGDDEELWRPVIRYSYSVGGKTYCGTRICFGVPNRFFWRNPSHPFFNRLQRGANVNVHHSPLWPSFSAVQTGVSPFVLITLAAAGALAWVGYNVVVFAQ